jgi:hypothetical protein
MLPKFQLIANLLANLVANLTTTSLGLLIAHGRNNYVDPTPNYDDKVNVLDGSL